MSAFCAPGKKALGGGFNGPLDMVVASQPAYDSRGWDVKVVNKTNAVSSTVYAYAQYARVT